jgi:hypothetical protein
MLVSELEKKAEIRINSASAAKSRPSDVSFKGGSCLYQCRNEMVEKNRETYKPLLTILKALN